MIKAVLVRLLGVAIMGKLSAFLSLASPIVAFVTPLFATAGEFLAWVVRSFFVELPDTIKNPARLTVSAAAFAVGLYYGDAIRLEKTEAVRTELNRVVKAKKCSVVVDGGWRIPRIGDFIP